MDKNSKVKTKKSKVNMGDVADIADTSGKTDLGKPAVSSGVGSRKKKGDVVLTATADKGTVNVIVEAKPDESADSLLRRFNREVMRAGLMRRLKELEFYEKPSTKKKKEKKMRAQRIKDYERWAE